MASRYKTLESRDTELEDLFEIPLVDLTEEERSVSSGPVDIQTATQGPCNTLNISSPRKKTSALTPPEIEARFCRLEDGTVVRIGDTLELKIPNSRDNGTLRSGDFLKITKIIRHHDTDEIQLRGFRYQREAYLLGRGSDGNRGRLNELAMHLQVREDDDRPATVQGLVTVPVSQIKRKREIIFTDKPYPMLSFRDTSRSVYSLDRNLTGYEQLKEDIFHNGPLVCRWTRTSIISSNGNTYGGIFHHVQNRKTGPHQRASVIADKSVQIRARKRPIRTLSLEELKTPPLSSTTNPIKGIRYTIIDIFCGAGGSSRGAVNAGLNILGGLDYDELAIHAWEQNNPGGLPFFMNVFEFLENDLYKVIGRCDFLSISNPCQPFSGSHTVPGENDELNIEALDTIEPLIKQIKPRIVVLENTSGLANLQRNQQYFNKVLRDIMNAGRGYDLRYQIVNMADYGLPQERKRLIVIAARRGIPLPPFPKATHGPPGSGLKPYVTIGDALQPLERLGERGYEDPYHHPNKMTLIREPSYDPFTKFIDCIMTSGTRAVHYSGKRRFTPRELAVLQSLPIQHHLTGSWSNATKQIGNMFPPLMAEIVYRTCAQTLEAFDQNFITAEDQIHDLDITLIEKGIQIPKLKASNSPLYQYLTRPQLRDAVLPSYSSAWQKRKIDAEHSKNAKKMRSLRISETEPLSQDRQATADDREQFWQDYGGTTITLEDEDE